MLVIVITGNIKKVLTTMVLFSYYSYYSSLTFVTLYLFFKITSHFLLCSSDSVVLITAESQGIFAEKLIHTWGL